jgi:hypothetical protein
MNTTVLALLIMIAAILSFFLDEFSSMLKKIYQVKWMRICVPLLIASGMVMSYYHMLLSFLLVLKIYFHGFMRAILSLLPFQYGSATIAQWLGLFIVTSLPVVVVYLILKYTRWMKPMRVVTRMYFILWIGLIILWVA